MSNRCNEIHESVQETIKHFLSYLTRNSQVFGNCKLLDVGCWDGTTTSSYADILQTNNKYGIEVFDEKIIEAEKRKVEVEKVDLEKDVFPFQENSFDVIVLIRF